MIEPFKLQVQPAEVEFKSANAWREMGKLERAAIGYQNAIRLQPNYAPAYLELGNLRLEQGKLDQAIVLFRDATELIPHDEGLRHKLSSLLARKESSSIPDTNVSSAEPRPDHKSENKGRPHVLLYTDRPGINGAEQINHALLCGLVAAGYQVTCAQNKTFHHLIQERKQLGIRHVWLSVDNLYDTTKTPRALSDTSEPYHVLKTIKPDLVIFGDGCPLSNLTAKRVARDLGIAYVTIVHCVTPAWAKQFAPYLPELSVLFQQAQAVIAVSRENLTLLHELFKLPRHQGQVIYNGRPEEFFAPPNHTVRHRLRQQLGIPQAAVVSFTSARMDAVKGYQHQLEAARSLKPSIIWPRLYLVWAGTGSIESRLRATAISTGVDEHIKFLDERPNIAEWLDIADMFVLPSHFEGMPLSIMEAMAKGLPVMATAVSGIPEELGETGKLLPDPNLDAQAMYGE